MCEVMLYASNKGNKLCKITKRSQMKPAQQEVTCATVSVLNVAGTIFLLCLKFLRQKLFYITFPTFMI